MTINRIQNSRMLHLRNWNILEDGKGLTNETVTVILSNDIGKINIDTSFNVLNDTHFLNTLMIPIFNILVSPF